MDSTRITWGTEKYTQRLRNIGVTILFRRKFPYLPIFLESRRREGAFGGSFQTYRGGTF
jgi:hypothetical protein